MALYAIPTSVLMANDSGTGIRVIAVQAPTNGATLQGSVRLAGTTVMYTAPVSTANAAITTDTFAYAIQDAFGQQRTANVRVAFPADIEQPAAFIGPYTIASLAGFSNGAYDVYISINPTNDLEDGSLYGTDILCIGTIINWNGIALNLAPGWTAGRTHTQGQFTLTEIQRVFTRDAYVALCNAGQQLKIITGTGNLPDGNSPPTGLAFDLHFFTCVGTETAPRLLRFDITQFGSGPQTVAFPNDGDSIVYDSLISTFLNTDADGADNPIVSTPPGQFLGYGNNFRCGAYGTNLTGNTASNPSNGITFHGQDAGFTCNRVFRAFYK